MRSLLSIACVVLIMAPALDAGAGEHEPSPQRRQHGTGLHVPPDPRALPPEWRPREERAPYARDPAIDYSLVPKRGGERPEKATPKASAESSAPRSRPPSAQLSTRSSSTTLGLGSIALIALVIFVGLRLAGPLLYLARVQWRKRARDVRFNMIFFQHEALGMKGVLVHAPLYDEESYFCLDLYAWGRIEIQFKPYETMLGVVASQLKTAQLLQVMRDGERYPRANPHLSDFKERVVESLDGAYVHTPNAVARGSLQLGVTDGPDLFYLCPEFDTATRQAFEAKVDEWRRQPDFRFLQEQDCIHAVGFLFSKGEDWQLCHKDESVIIEFANALFEALVAKLFARSNVRPAAGYVAPSPGEIFKDFFAFSGQANRLRLRVEGNSVVITRDHGGLSQRHVQAVHLVAHATGRVARHLGRGASALNQRRYDTAIKEFTKVLTADPRNTDALVNRSFAYTELGRFEKAIADCNAAIAVDRTNAGAYGNRAVAKLRMGDMPSAILDYDVAIELSPELLPAILGRGSAHLASGNRALAIADFTRALELSPTEAEVFFNRGIAYLGSGQFEEALADFTETLRLNPAHPRAGYEREFACRVLAFRRIEAGLAVAVADSGLLPLAEHERAEHVRECIHSCREVKDYRTTLIVRDLCCKELEPYGYELIKWRAELSGTDASHVYQSSRLEDFPNGADGEWVTVGARQFQKLGSLAESEMARPYSPEIEAFLRVDRYAKLLDSTALSDIAMYGDAANDWLIAVCAVAPTVDLGGCTAAELRSRFARWLQHMVVQLEGGAFIELPYGRLWSAEPWGWPPEVAPGTSARFVLLPTVSDKCSRNSIAKHHDLLVESPEPFQLTLWIERARHYIVKSVLQLNGRLANGEPVALRVEHAFSDWGGDIVVRAE